MSEIERKHWKLKLENKGKLYTHGLFSITQHTNYFGDLILFSGWMLLTTYKFMLIIPFIMLLGFIFQSIPELNDYLKKKYPQEFEKYQKSTPHQLIPFIY
jgi:steroid 5-alpha reductase family enzyme